MGGGEILKKGWLIKSPPLEGSGMKSWRKRWFCLRSSKILEYYKSETGDLKGVINLEDCIIVHSALFHKKHKHVFDITTRDRTYYLVAPSADEMHSWVAMLCQVCEFTSTSVVTSEERSPGIENMSPGSKRHSATLPNHTSIRASPLPLLPSSEEQDVSGKHDPLKVSSSEATSNVLKPVKLSVEVPPGTSFTQALAAKGYGSSKTMSSVRRSTESTGTPSRLSGDQKDVISAGYYVPRPPDGPGYLESIGFQVYDVPTNNSPAVSLASCPTGVPDWYDIPRSLTVANNPTCTLHSERAQTLSNGYMVPRLLTKTSVAPIPNYDYPPPPRVAEWATPPSNMYDVPPPPKPVESSSISYQTYDVPPPPRPLDSSTPPRSLDTVTSSSSSSPNQDFPLPQRSTTPPNQRRSVLLQNEGGVIVKRDSVDAPFHEYVNIRIVENMPPPIDRTTKPCPPKIDRSTKPGRNSEGPSDSPDGSPPDLDSKHDSIISEETEELFSPRDIPRLTSRSVHYCQIEFEKIHRKPVPTPRTKLPSSSPPTANTNVNYIDVDITALTALSMSREEDSNIDVPANETENVSLSEPVEQESSIKYCENESDIDSDESLEIQR